MNFPHQQLPHPLGILLLDPENVMEHKAHYIKCNGPVNQYRPI